MRFLFVIAFIAGCAHNPPATRPPVDVDWRAIAGAVVAAMDAIPADTKEACFAVAATKAVVLSAPDFIGRVSIPGVDLNIEGCAQKSPAKPPDGATSAIALGAVLLQLQASRLTDECTKSWLVAAIDQLEAAALAVVDELSNPDGLIFIPPIPINCEE